MPTAKVTQTDQFGFKIDTVVDRQPTATSAVDTAGPAPQRGATKSLDTKTCEDLMIAIQSSNAASVDSTTKSEPRGKVFFPSTDGFEKARTSVWNYDAAGMPLAIVKCANAEHVSLAIGFAQKNEVKVCVHTAGAHSSHAVVNDCVVIDLSLLRNVTVDPETQTATIAGGVRHYPTIPLAFC